MRALRMSGVTLYGGPTALKGGLTDQAVKELNTEYGGLGMTIEVVSGLAEAVDHIHLHGRYYF